MADNIGVRVFGKAETNGEPARICIRVVIWNQRKTCGIRKSGRDRSRFPSYVRSARQRSRILRRGECSFEQNALRVSRPEAGVKSEDCIELFEQILAQSNELLV